MVTREEKKTEEEKKEENYRRCLKELLGRMLAWAYRYCRNRDQAEDAVMEVFGDLWGCWDDVHYPNTWLRTRIRWKFLRDYQQGKAHLEVSMDELTAREDTIGELLPDTRPAAMPEEALLQKQKWAMLRDCLNHLPYSYQYVVRCCIADMSYAETAQFLYLCESTVKSRLFVARKKLACCLQTKEDANGTS